MSTKSKKVFPNQALEKRLIAEGVAVVCMWQLRGPENTGVAWLECLMANHVMLIVETYRDGGWEVFTAAQSVDVDLTVAEVLSRVKR